MSGDPLRLFDLVQIINLRSRPDRRHEMETELGRIGSGLEPGRVEFFEAAKPQEPGEFESIGARGCFMSHLAALERAVERQAGSLLILEDDVRFSDHFRVRMQALGRRLQEQEWSFFYGGHDQAPDAARTEDQVLWRVPPSQGIVTAHCIALQGAAISGAAGFLRQILARRAGDPLGGPMHVDGAYSTYRAAHPECVTLVANPPLATQRSSRSDIHALRWFDRIRPVGAAVDRLRRLKNSL